MKFCSLCFGGLLWGNGQVTKKGIQLAPTPWPRPLGLLVLGLCFQDPVLGQAVLSLPVDH